MRKENVAGDFDAGVMAATKAIMNRIDSMVSLEVHAQKQGGIAERQLAPIRMNLLLQLSDELKATMSGHSAIVNSDKQVDLLALGREIQLVDALDELFQHSDEDCPPEYRTEHLRSALTEAEGLLIHHGKRVRNEGS